MHARPRTVAAALALCALPAPWLARWLAPASNSDSTALWQMLGAQAFFAALAVLAALRLGGSLRGALGLGFRRAALAPLALGVLGTLALSGALQDALDALGLTPGSSLERLTQLAGRASPAQPALVFVAFAVAPALGEEILCRGAFQRGLERRLGAFSVVLSALVFGALHLDPVHGPAALVLGLYLGALARWGDSTWVSIACHLANNGVATLPLIDPSARFALPRPVGWPGVVAWLAFAGLALAGARALSRFRGSPDGGPSGPALRRRNGAEE